MANSKTLHEQEVDAKFSPDETIVVLFAATVFNALWTIVKKGKDKGKITQLMADLDTTIQDCEDFKDVVKKYKVEDKNIIRLYDPT
jgi:hypothetical protein